MKVRTLDEVIVDVPENIVKESELLTDLTYVSSTCENDVIPLPQVDDVTLAFIIEYHSDHSPISLKEASDEALLHIVNACLFMSMSKLYDACIKEYQQRVATYYAKNDVSALRRLLPIRADAAAHKN